MKRFGSTTWNGDLHKSKGPTPALPFPALVPMPLLLVARASLSRETIFFKNQ